MARVTAICLTVLAVSCLPAAASTIFVDHAGGGDYLTIQEGLDAAATGDTVLVAAGLYAGPLNRDLTFAGKALVLVSDEGPSETAINCEWLGRGFTFYSVEPSETVVDGFTIRNGFGGSGGGIDCRDGAEPTIRNCRIVNCSASYGAGMNCENQANAVIEDCLFIDNYASEGGGGLRSTGHSKTTLRNVVFSGNHGYFGGGMIARDNSNAILQNVVFEGNDAVWSGGMRIEYSNASLTDVLFRDNHADQMGGGLGVGWGSETSTFTNCTFLYNSSPIAGGMICWAFDGVITNCTFARNSGNPGGLFVKDDATVLVSNSIFAFNQVGKGLDCQPLGQPTVTWSCVYGNDGGDDLCGTYYDNLYVDPFFCDLPGYDVTLMEDSPCLPENNQWGQLIGAHGQGCAGPVPVEERSWGAIKGMYR